MRKYINSFFLQNKTDKILFYLSSRMPQQYMSAICHKWLSIGWSAVIFETNYGLMQQFPTEIKEKLLNALDNEYNVVDMGAVVEIITILERTPITKEALETTRLGKYINELRRKTNNDSLAKRAKDLVRRWRDMIKTQPVTQPPFAPSQEPSSMNGKSISLPTSPEPSIDAVPRTHASNKRLRKDDSPDSKKDEPSTKISKLNGSTTFNSERGENSNSRDSFINYKSDTEIVPQNIIVTIDDEPAEIQSTGPKKRGRKKGSKNKATLLKAAAAFTQKSSEDIVNDKIAALARTPKVKTTKELLKDLNIRSGVSNDDDCVIKLPQSIENKASLANCVINNTNDHSSDDEIDIIEITPPKTKSIETSVKYDHNNLYSNRESKFNERVSNECDNSISIEKDKKSKKHKHKLDKSNEKQEKEKSTDHNNQLKTSKSSQNSSDLPSTSKHSELCTVEEILARLPPLNLDEIDWSEDIIDTEPNTPKSICNEEIEEIVDRLHTDNIEGMNGNFEKIDDDKTEFREWHEMLTLNHTEDEPPLFVLPYTVID